MRSSRHVSLISLINEVHSSLEELLDSRLERLGRLSAENREELKAEMDNKMRKNQDNLDLDIGQLSARLDRMEVKLDEARRQAFKFQSDVSSLIIAGLPFVEGEIPLEKVNTLLFEGLHCDPLPEIVNVERMRLRGRGLGVIKVELRTHNNLILFLSFISL